jgi:hypothetical protein
VRDEFDVRHFPDDVYGVRLRSFLDLPGGDELAEIHIMWGVAKAALVREERGSLFERPGSGHASEPDQ